MKLHTVLGAGGAIADGLVPILLSNNEKLRLVSRNPRAVRNVETVAADVTDFAQTLEAVKGSSVVYLLVGLPYDIRIWRESWPRIMSNVINACKETRSSLIFLDNVYMYGKVDGKMTETTPFNPCSKKGEIRAAIASQLLNEIKAGNIRAMIGRSADFYGPGTLTTSAANMLVFGNMKKGKKAQWLGKADMPHSLTYIPDAAKALYLLANRGDAFGQTWHLPTANNPLTGKEFIQEAAAAMQQNPSFSVISTWMMRFAGLFNRPIKELIEMNYQHTFPYIFDAGKFNQAFAIEPMSYKDGIKETARWIMTTS